MLLKKQDSLLILIDIQEKLVPHLLNREPFIARCEWLLKLANRIDIPVLASEQYPQGLGSTIESLTPYLPKEKITKVHFSCMHEPRFAQALQAQSKKQLVLFGIEAHVCVLQTALEMITAGFEVFVVVDAVTSRHEIDLKYGLKRMKQEGVQLVTAEMVFFEWIRQAGSSEFKALSKEFMQ